MWRHYAISCRYPISRYTGIPEKPSPRPTVPTGITWPWTFILITLPSARPSVTWLSIGSGRSLLFCMRTTTVRESVQDRLCCKFIVLFMCMLISDSKANEYLIQVIFDKSKHIFFFVPSLHHLSHHIFAFCMLSYFDLWRCTDKLYKLPEFVACRSD